MPAGLEVLAGFTTAPGVAAFVNLTAATGDSFTIRAAQPNTDIRLMAMWANNNVQGNLRVISPRLHDNVQGIRTIAQVALPAPAFPRVPVQKLYSQDALVPANTGSAVAAEIESGFLLIWYQDVAGIAARFIDYPSLMSRGVNLVGNEVSITTIATGNWGGASALNKNFDNLKANTDYAILGCTLSALCGAVGIKGPDTGNLRIGIPGAHLFPILIQNWFVDLARHSGIPLIPVINSANKAGTFIDVQTDDEAVAEVVDLTLVELSPMGAPSPTARPAGA